MTDEIDFLAAEAERSGAVGAAAFLAMLADAIKALAADEKARAVALAIKHRAESTTGKHEGLVLGKLRQNSEKVEWSCTGGPGNVVPAAMEPGGDLYEWVDKHHPSWIEVHPAEVITREVPERRYVNHARMVELCETLKPDGTDPATGEVVPGLRREVTPGNWVLTKDRNAKALVAQAVRAMLEKGLPLGPRQIEGGS